ncbi:MAG: sulfite exporter TauE/SafE family protein [Sulfuriflexus sp.]|nr:sulfite exporter TauE/SafE family protein [Sulfuriflexus sp.]
MSLTLILILTVVCVFTYAFEITFGLAGTIMMLAAMSYFIDAKMLVIYSILPQILVATIGLSRSPKTVKLNVLAGMVAVAALGSLLGFYIFNRIPIETFRSLLAIVITLFGVYLVIAPGKLKLTGIAARVLDFIAGISQALFGISGPIAMTRLLATHTDKLVIRNYALAFFLSVNVFRGIGYAVNGSVTEPILEMMYISAPILAVSLWYSNHLHFKVRDEHFKKIVAWIILFGGISLFFAQAS